MIKNLKMSVLMAGLSLASVSAAIANEITFNLQYTGGNGDDGSGQVTATEISPGTYLATSGSFTLNAGPYNPYSSSLVTIPGNGTPGSVYYSELYGGTVLNYDDLIVEDAAAPSGYTTTYVGGLLFNEPTYSFSDGSTGMAVYFSQNSPGDASDYYTFWSGGAHNEAYQVESGALTISAVPDRAVTASLLGLSLFSLGCMTRLVRKSAAS